MLRIVTGRIMTDIYHDFPIRASLEDVFRAVSTPEGLDTWWTSSSRGAPREGSEYELRFGPEYEWRGTVTRCLPNTEFEILMTTSDDDWDGTLVGFRLEPRCENTWVSFYHTGWPAANEHYRISCNCWAMYLRVLRRHLEHGEIVPYEKRLDV